ncbi:uncharacterized protein LOC143915867 [Arctopsyche grandis]|uniref:uncharacterized protein LOC143915867 n=1 Tax=Arctopsyche grandis TaxID=121162 RepID=UPI00406D906C
MQQSEAMSGEMAEMLIKHQKEFLSNATECKMKVGATDEDVLIFMSRKKLPDTKTGDCFIACMMEKMDLIQNGKYLEDATQMMAHKILGPGDMVAELIGDVSKACAKTITADDDSCKAAKKIAECSMLHVKKFKEVTKKM